MRSKHVREPATEMVVMPGSMMRAIGVAKHCGKAYTRGAEELSNRNRRDAESAEQTQRRV
jgi:hypothetical protein